MLILHLYLIDINTKYNAFNDTETTTLPVVTMFTVCRRDKKIRSTSEFPMQLMRDFKAIMAMITQILVSHVATPCNYAGHQRFGEPCCPGHPENGG
jgi:hypothetical protein